MNVNRNVNTAALIAIGAVALSRVIPHWPNFTPVMAIALVGGALFASRLTSIVVPVLAMALSDLVLGVVLGSEYALHGAQPWVYASVIGIAVMGHAMRQWSSTKLVLAGGTIAGVAFFLVTNFAVWFSGTMYPATLEGLVACYAAGLAFYRDGGNFLLNGIVSTWIYAATIIAIPLAIRRLQLVKI